jgi:hydrogenase expression/formation protein HypC
MCASAALATLIAMCLGVPGRVERVWEDEGTAMGTVDFGGVRKDVCLAYVPEAVVGDYTIVHVGFAITKLDEASALETLELFRSAGILAQEFADPLLASGAGGPPHPGSPPAAEEGPGAQWDQSVGGRPGADGDEGSEGHPGVAGGESGQERPGPSGTDLP